MSSLGEYLHTPEAIAHVAMMTYAVTFLAQLGSHSPLHYVVGETACLVEMGTFFAAQASVIARDFGETEKSKKGLDIARKGVLGIALCFVAVPISDNRYWQFFSTPGNNFFSPHDWKLFLEGVMVPDMEESLEKIGSTAAQIYNYIKQ